MLLSELAKAGRQPELPLEVALPDVAASLRLERLLRVLPGRRYVGVAFWNGNGTERKVLAKLLLGAKARRDFEREERGALLLAAQGIDTPRLLSSAFVAGEGGYLLFDYLEGTQSLGERWQAREFVADRDARQARILEDALRSIARLHAKGLFQEDLHLNNLLYQRGILYLVDGGGIRAESPGAPLSVQKTLENLGVFFAQLPSRLDVSLEKWLDVYMETNPCHSLPPRLAALRKAIDRAKRFRMRDLMKKTGRDCSLFSVKKNGPLGIFGFCATRREVCDTRDTCDTCDTRDVSDVSGALARIVENPDAFIARGHIYKTGGAATVARVEEGGHSFVVKRHNIKHFWHWLGRCWRPSRAWTSWREGNRLLALGIHTAKPLAVIERRYLGLRGTAFLITEYLDGQDIIARFCGKPSGGEDMPEPLETELTALEELFAALRRERISHGDFKGNNLLWRGGNDYGSWSLIDLDAMRARRCLSGFARAYARDRERFLRNWPPDSPLFRLLEKRIPARADGED
ncbi:MAG: lipopolysaccharide kinase InaA family protein [Candidatus Accumulibacter sp.]|nr:lipopolysaccharide kinase InaA family protein [Accumulibacter sp.]